MKTYPKQFRSRFGIGLIYFIYILVTSACYGKPAENSDNKIRNEEQAGDANRGSNIMLIQHSVGRLNFSLPKSFDVLGRYHNIYRVEVSAEPLVDALVDVTPQQFWQARVKALQDIHQSVGAKTDTFVETRIEVKGEANTFHVPAAVYRSNATFLDNPTIETMYFAEREILKAIFHAAPGKESKILQLLALVVSDYRDNVSYGFNIGAGSLIGEPSANEKARISFEDSTLRCELMISTQTPGKHLEDGPLSGFSGNLLSKFFGDVSTRIARRESRELMSLRGEEGLLLTKDKTNNDSELTYTWFYPGETANPLKPEILIKMQCPKGNHQHCDQVWQGLLHSISMRPTVYDGL